MEMESSCTRRRLLLLAGVTLAGTRLRAATSDFWNRKPPSQWTTEEIDRLITKSPWAKEVRAQYASGESPATGNGGGYPGGNSGGNPGGGYPSGGNRGGNPGGNPSGNPSGNPGGGYPGSGGQGRSRGGIGGLSIPGIGGIGFPGGGRPRNGGGTPRGGAASGYQGTVRWESALPVQDAMKAPLPEAFEGRYVICVAGIPLMGSSYQGEEEDSASSRRKDQDELDRVKGLSSLQVKGRDLVQAGVVVRQVTSGASFLFGFSKDILPLSAHDSEVDFTTQLGRLVVKARFPIKEMLYHGELAV